MGKKPEPKTERNREIYSVYQEKGTLSKKDREELAQRFNIHERRVYKIIEQVRRKIQNQT